MGRIYPTKVDWWIALILVGSMAVLIYSAVLFFVGPPGQGSLGAVVAVVCLLLAAWVGYIPLSTNYEMGQTHLVIRSGGFRWRVPLDSIIEVVPTHNPLSSPACSLDRLRVNYYRRSGRTGYVLISPREKEAFLRDLASAVSGLHLVDDRLVRRG